MSAVGAMRGFRGARPLVRPRDDCSRMAAADGGSSGADRVVSASNGQAAVRVWADAGGARAVDGRTPCSAARAIR